MTQGCSSRKTTRIASVALICAGLFAPATAHSINAISFKLFGYVRDALDRPLAGATVSSTYTTCDISSECVNTSSTTSSTGYYQITLASTGTIGLTVSRSNLVSQTKTRSIKTPQDTQVDFSMLYRLSASQSKTYHSAKNAASSAAITVTSFAPQPNTGATGSCVVVADSRTGNTSAASQASVNPDGSSTWNWTLNVPKGTGDGSYTLTVFTRACGGQQSVLTQTRTLTYVVDSTAPQILNLTPMDGQNTIFASQPLQAAIRDTLAGINASAITFTMTDRTTGSVTTYGVTYNAATGIATSTSPASLLTGHDYTVRVAVTDRAGNAAEDGHRPWIGASSGDNGGFRKITMTGTQATGSISVSCPVTGNALNLVATCSSVSMSVSNATVTVPDSRHGYDTAYVLHTIALTSAEIKAGLKSTNAYSRRIATGTEWGPRQIAYAYRIGDRLELPATSTATPPAPTLSLGTLKVSVPSEWYGASSVTLTMQAPTTYTAGGTLTTGACASPLTSAVPCSTDPVWSRFDVRFDPAVADPDQLLTRHTGWGARLVKDWRDDELRPSYEAIIPPAARSLIAADTGVTGVDAVRSANLQDRYESLLAQMPAAPPGTTGTHLRWEHEATGVTQEIALSPSAPSRVTVTPPFVPADEDPPPPGAATGPVDVVEVTPVAPALSGDTPVRSAARSRARYESAGVPYWIESMPVGEDGMRIVVQLREASAPATYDFALTMPEGTELLQGENGSAAIVRERAGAPDLPLGYFASPFAYDAEGREVPITQTVTETSIRLTLGLTGSEVYPILADPTYVAISCSSATTSGSSADFLEDTRRCPYGVTFVWSKGAEGYWPVKARTAGPSTNYRQLRQAGSCTGVPDTGLVFDFQVPCQMHDYGYDLIRVKDPWDYLGVNKNDTDYEFLEAMNEHCGDRNLFFKPDCYARGSVYYAGVVALGWPNRHQNPASWPSTSFLRNGNFASGLTYWTKTGSGSLVVERDPNSGWYHAEMSCLLAPGCGLYQDAPVLSNLRGGESLIGEGQLHCDHTSGSCNYTLRMEIKRVSDGAWVYADSCSWSVPTHNPVGWYDVCGVYETVPLNNQYSHVRYKLTSSDTGRRLDLRFPVLRMS